MSISIITSIFLNTAQNIVINLYSHLLIDNVYTYKIIWQYVNILVIWDQYFLFKSIIAERVPVHMIDVHDMSASFQYALYRFRYCIVINDCFFMVAMFYLISFISLW